MQQKADPNYAKKGRPNCPWGLLLLPFLILL